MVESVTNFLKEYVSAELVVFIISLLPILELRGGLVAAALVGIDWYVALPIAIAILLGAMFLTKYIVNKKAN